MENKSKFAHLTAGDWFWWIAVITCLCFGEPLLIQYTFNWLVAEPFSIPEIAFWQTLGLVQVCDYFTGRRALRENLRLSDGTGQPFVDKKLNALLGAAAMAWIAHLNTMAN